MESTELINELDRNLHTKASPVTRARGEMSQGLQGQLKASLLEGMNTYLLMNVTGQECLLAIQERGEIQTGREPRDRRICIQSNTYCICIIISLIMKGRRQSQVGKLEPRPLWQHS